MRKISVLIVLLFFVCIEINAQVEYKVITSVESIEITKNLHRNKPKKTTLETNLKEMRYVLKILKRPNC